MSNLQEIINNLNGTTSQDEYQKFKTKLQTNQHFAEEVVFYLNTKNKTIEVMRNQRFYIFNRFHLPYMAAAATLLILVATVVFSSQKSVLTPGVLMGKESIKKTSTDSSVLKNKASFGK